jgi:acetolactate synthase-1/2/3 large subunit
VLVTSGPGATNAVTGIADAFLDSIPMVVITGQVPTALIGSDAFQEADTVGITRHCTKHNYLVKDPAQLAAIIDEAFRIATEGRPGPVVIDIPKDVQIASTRWTGQPSSAATAMPASGSPGRRLPRPWPCSPARHRCSTPAVA